MPSRWYVSPLRTRGYAIGGLDIDEVWSMSMCVTISSLSPSCGKRGRVCRMLDSLMDLVVLDFFFCYWLFGSLVKGFTSS